ncbi:MAG: hypothetical protein WD607_01615 [Candidatus Paceibacterota bacterium]
MKNFRSTFWTFAVTVLCLIFSGFLADNVAAQPAGEMTEAIYVDITAHHMFYTGYFMKLYEEGEFEDEYDLSMQLSEKMASIYEMHGVTDSEYDEYADQLMEDPQKYLDILSKINERVEELSEEVEQ